MDKTVAGLLGAVGALVSAGPGQAAPAEPRAVLAASSYADLLRPIPNAVEALKALEAEEAQGRVQEAQYYPYYYPPAYVQPYYYHHHHHHNYYYRPSYHHHHRYERFEHHHHHHGYGRF